MEDVEAVACAVLVLVKRAVVAARSMVLRMVASVRGVVDGWRFGERSSRDFHGDFDMKEVWVLDASDVCGGAIWV